MFHGGGWWSYISYDENKGQPQLSWALIRRVWGYARPYRLQTAILLVTIFTITGLSLIPPLLYRDLIDRAIPDRDFARLNWLALGMIGIPLLNALIGLVQRYLSAAIGESLIADLRNALFDHLQHMSLRFFTNTKSGELISRINNDVVDAQRALTGTFVTILTNVVTVAATLGIMFSLEWRLTLIGIAILPLFIWPARRVGRLLRQIRRESMDLNAKMHALMAETLNVSGALLVKLFGRQQDEMEKFHDRSRRVAAIGVRQAAIGRWFFVAIGLMSAIGTAVVFWAGGHLVLRGAFTVGTIVAFSSYLMQLYGPLSAMTNAHVEFVTSMVSFERVFEILDLPLEIEDRPDAIDYAPPAERGRERNWGRVTFEGVSFSYAEAGQPAPLAPGLPPGEDSPPAPGDGRESDLRADGLAPVSTRQMALDDVSFEIQPGQLAALVGPSGAGKTTITYLLPRLYDPTAGRICLDGHDLRDLSQRSLAEAIGMVTQETYLFHDTIRANLLYARPQASQAEIEAACRAANIHDFIASLPDGYDTVVGERGYRLSGGEKQRVAIARVILKDPLILVLDEATSSLDSQSEALIQEALERIMQKRTSLVIAHRLSTILAADVILVLDEGRLVEQGHGTATRSAHEELLARGGLYAQLYRTQFRALEPAAAAPPEVSREGAA